MRTLRCEMIGVFRSLQSKTIEYHVYDVSGGREVPHM